MCNTGRSVINYAVKAVVLLMLLKNNMNDFDRFNLRRAKQSLNKVVRLRFLKLKSLAKKSAKKGEKAEPKKK